MRRFLKAGSLSLLAAGYVLLSCFLGLLLSRAAACRHRIRLTSLVSKAMLRILGIRVVVEKSQRQELNFPTALFVSNHLSYLDILVISSLIPASFVSSVEISEDKLLGFLCRLGGTYFVERRTSQHLRKEVKELCERLTGGVSLMLFPEGTSGDGSRVLPFKSGILLTASLAHVPIQPICLNYRELDGSAVRTTNKDRLFWYGDMTFLSHFWNMLSLRSVAVSLTLLPSVHPDDFSFCRDIPPCLNKQISAAYHPIDG